MVLTDNARAHAHGARDHSVKRELSELKEAAEAAEEAMGQQAQELARLRAEGKAKDERIKKLDAVKLTTEQVGRRVRMWRGSVCVRLP